MGRPLRAAEGGIVYHALNRATGRRVIFATDGDYEAFEKILAEAVARQGMRLLAYCIMPTHFHLMLWPRADGDLSRFMRWLSLTHTQRWHAHRSSAGTGPVYQGRFKSFPVQDDEHFLTACRYVERNPLRAGLVTKAESWRWSSLGRMTPRAEATTSPPSSGSASTAPVLSPWPIPRPADWLKRVNTPLSAAEEEAMQRAILRGQPLGGPSWQGEIAARLGLQSTFRPRGRPRTPPKGV